MSKNRKIDREKCVCTLAELSCASLVSTLTDTTYTDVVQDTPRVHRARHRLTAPYTCIRHSHLSSIPYRHSCSRRLSVMMPLYRVKFRELQSSNSRVDRAHLRTSGTTRPKKLAYFNEYLRIYWTDFPNLFII